LNPGRCGGKLATNCLSYGAALTALVDNKVTTNHPGYTIFFDGNIRHQGKDISSKTLGIKHRKKTDFSLLM
jgi:hypothetical protein